MNSRDLKIIKAAHNLLADLRKLDMDEALDVLSVVGVLILRPVEKTSTAVPEATEKEKPLTVAELQLLEAQGRTDIHFDPALQRYAYKNRAGEIVHVDAGEWDSETKRFVR